MVLPDLSAGQDSDPQGRLPTVLWVRINQPASGGEAVVTMRVLTLLRITTLWRPGSHDSADSPEGANLAWTWAHEAHDLMTRDREVLAGVANRVMLEGIDFGNAYGASICLGSDGRVWDGHHRIVAGLAMGIEFATVDVVEP